ncbi:hypothetical protein BJ166DRAFT_517532 [Pestalotiopsis sp. NC0098]|nr:hypothetical protein BJ166DRAFT_517532 [Pestalotiopsis sp. NC0098]
MVLALRALSARPIIRTVHSTTPRSFVAPPSSAILRQPVHRAMSSDASRPAITTPPAGKYEFLVVVPDKPGAQQKRLEVRPKHFEGLTALVDQGIFKVGGATLHDVPEGTDASKWAFHGSTIVMVAESREECKEILSKDIYATSGVWDIDNAQIWPVKLAFRYP